jgi:hypothetical protein
MSENDTVALARDLLKWHYNYLLLVELPQQIKKFSISLSLNESVPPRNALSPTIPKFKRLLFRISRLIGGTFSIGFNIPMRHVVGGAKSTHIEIQAPSGFRVVDAGVLTEYFDPVIGDRELEANERRFKISELTREFGQAIGPHQIFRDDDDVPESAHIYISELPLEVKNARLFVGLYAYRTGFIIEAL